MDVLVYRISRHLGCKVEILEDLQLDVDRGLTGCLAVPGFEARSYRMCSLTLMED